MKMAQYLMLFSKFNFTLHDYFTKNGMYISKEVRFGLKTIFDNNTKAFKVLPILFLA